MNFAFKWTYLQEWDRNIDSNLNLKASYEPASKTPHKPNSKYHAIGLGSAWPAAFWHFPLPCLRPPCTCRACSEVTSASALCKCLASGRQCRPGSVQPGHTQRFHRAPKLFTFGCIGSLKTSTWQPQLPSLSATARDVDHCHLCPRQE